ncbi:hypothetical protein PF011_g26235 [Phytophthora fragariae]|uniref:AGC-kinase C-terminal domain-containing protein n=1 Tax=Phytophthora fragariae TaxID=53985 RepID=A0A6A3HT78_9STRA|nr:hypothetical protein PF011_g26235 [Phytophthora fragariae]
MSKQHQVVLCVLVLLDTTAEFLRVIVVEFRMRMMPDIAWIPKIKFVTSADMTLQGSIGENGGQDGEVEDAEREKRKRFKKMALKIARYAKEDIPPANQEPFPANPPSRDHPVIYQSHMFVDFVSVDTYVEHPRQHGAVRRSNIGDFDMNKMFDSTTDNDPRSHEPLIGDYARFGTMNKQLLNSQIPLPVA